MKNEPSWSLLKDLIIFFLIATLMIKAHNNRKLIRDCIDLHDKQVTLIQRNSDLIHLDVENMNQLLKKLVGK